MSMACLKSDVFFIYFKKIFSYLYMPIILKTHAWNLSVVIRSNTCYFTDLVAEDLSKSGQALNVTQLKKVRPAPYTCYFYFKKSSEWIICLYAFPLTFTCCWKTFPNFSIDNETWGFFTSHHNLRFCSLNK